MDIILRRVISLFLVTATLLLVYWPSVTHGKFHLPIRYDLFFFFAVLFFSFYFLKELFFRKISFNSHEAKVFIALAFTLISIFIATVISYFKYELSFNFVGMTLLLKLLLGVGTFTTILYLMKKDINQKLHKILVWSLILPSTIIALCLFIPDLVDKWGFISYGYRFVGPTTNPCAIDLIAIISFSYLYSFIIFNQFSNQKKFFRDILYGVALFGLAGIILWSQSRSFTLSMLIISILTTLFYGFYFRVRKSKVIFYLILSMTLIGSSFFIIPSQAQKFFLYGRMLGESTVQVFEKRQHAQLGQLFSGEKLIVSHNFKKIGSIIKDDPRVNMWRYFFPLMFKNPLGLGLNYQAQFVYKIGELTPTFIFNMWALGGFVAMFFMCYFLFILFWKFKIDMGDMSSLKLLPYRVGTLSALIIALFISLFYGLPIDYMGFWVICGLAMS